MKRLHVQWFGRQVENASGMSRMRLHSGHLVRVLYFFLFLQLFDVFVVGSIVLDLTCASVFKNCASARRVKQVFGTHEKLKCRAFNILLASESHAWVSTPLSSWHQGRARPEGQTCRLQSRGDDHHDFEDLRHVPQKKRSKPPCGAAC